MRDEVVSEVMRRITDIITGTELQCVRDSIAVVLDDYEVTRKETLPMSINNDWQKTLEEFLVTKMVEGKSLATIKQYGLELNILLKNLNKSVSDITSGAIFKFFTLYKKSRGVSNQTLENKRLVYSSFFTWLINRGKIASNPMLSISPFKVEKRIKKAFTDEERQKLLDACINVREKALIEMLYSSCIRVGELVKLNINDIHFAEKELIVYGKGNKERTVYINAKASMYLKEYIKNRDDENEALFVSMFGGNERLTKAAIQAILRDVGARAGVDKVHPHRFRRTGATNALNRGMPIQEVSALLGHNKLETTMIYCSIDKLAIKYNHGRYLAA